MPFILLLIGAIIVITAYQGTHGQLGAALQQDLGGYLKWAFAIAAILALGFVPGFKTPSRWLLALVALVIVVTQYKNIVAGIQSFTGTAQAGSAAATVPSAAAVTGQGTVAPDPTAAGATGAITPSSLSGSAPAQIAPTNNAPPATPNPWDPATVLGAFQASTQGFGSSL